jgi:predicted urease superfamily metal-dependent hydrolase
MERLWSLAVALERFMELSDKKHGDGVAPRGLLEVIERLIDVERAPSIGGSGRPHTSRHAVVYARRS